MRILRIEGHDGLVRRVKKMRSPSPVSQYRTPLSDSTFISKQCQTCPYLSNLGSLNHNQKASTVILGRCIRDIVVVTMKIEAEKIESEGVTEDPSSVLGAKWTRTGYGVPSRHSKLRTFFP